MGFDHFKYITSPEWYAIREKVMIRDGCRCFICGEFSIWNEVHHITYKNIGKQKEINDCFTLCKTHHHGIHLTNNYLEKHRKRF